YHARIDDQDADDSDKQSAVTAADASAGPPLSILVVLSRIQQVPALMTLLGYLHHQPKAASNAGAIAGVRGSLYRPIRVFGLRLLELTGRESSVMQHYESASQVAADPVMGMFRAFARVAHLAFHAALAHSDREHFADNILHSAQDADAELTIVSAFGRGGSAARRPAKTPDVLTPGWFESMGWGFSTEQQAAFIASLFDKARNHVCVFIDCGLADYGDAAPPAPGDAASQESPGAAVRISDDAIAPEAPTAGRGVPVVVVPFFGGPDDRQALRLASDLCTHSAVRVVVWRFVKASRPSSRDVVLHEAQYPAQPNIPQTPAAARLRASDGSEANPWELALNSTSRKQSVQALADAHADAAALDEAAERLEDEAFIDAHLRPSDSLPARHERRGSAASARAAGLDAGGVPPSDEPALLELAPTTTRETSGSDPATDEPADAAGGRGGLRGRITQRLRFRRRASQSADDAGSGGASTLTEGVRATRFPNMTVHTTVTATPLQTLLLRSRALRAADLIICGRSVRTSLPYFSSAQELRAYTPAGHVHTRDERQRALGTAAEYLLGFGTPASILVVQAGSDPGDPEALRTKRDE
ncbi:hypothetical protein H4R21_004733, partial [Coemansia helicoidea]